MTDVWGNWFPFKCPDAAREAADKALVADGKLEASRAFVRMGDWEPAPECGTGYMTRRQASGAAPLTMTACGEEGRASSDASAVANGWLDPYRAFKAGPASAVGGGTLLWAGATGTMYPQNTATRMQPEKHNSEPAWVADVAANVKAQHVVAISAVTAKLPTPSIAGVAFGTIAASSYGWIVAAGDCLVRGDGIQPGPERPPFDVLRPLAVHGQERRLEHVLRQPGVAEEASQVGEELPLVAVHEGLERGRVVVVAVLRHAVDETRAQRLVP
jgi:hypothetical protein